MIDAEGIDEFSEHGELVSDGVPATSPCGRVGTDGACPQ